MFKLPVIIDRPAYGLTKLSGTLAVQLLSDTIPPEKMQIITFHPGMIHGDGWLAFGVTKDMFPFDEDNLPGGFAVWAASKEAEFLHGRFVWSSWDVEELSKGKTRKSIEENEDFLRIGMVGLKGANLA
ncbi:Fc.00g094390.m01.CDS01 [Cosmosporella sp. VM-42]